VDHTKEVEEGVNLDFDANGKLYGIEILDTFGDRQNMVRA
jgi:uncharacterized protein YuzE